MYVFLTGVGGDTVSALVSALVSAGFVTATLETLPFATFLVGDKTLLFRLGGATGAEGVGTDLDAAVVDLDLAVISLGAATVWDFTFWCCRVGFVTENVLKMN